MVYNGKSEPEQKEFNTYEAAGKRNVPN